MATSKQHPTPTRLARRIRAARKRAGLSTTTLAAALGVTEGMVAHLETGRRLPSPGLAARIALALGLDVEELNS